MPRLDQLLLFAGFLSGASSLHISVQYPKALPSLFIRGDGCGLNWDSGVPLAAADKLGHTHGIDVSCPDSLSSLQFKVLVDDDTWQIGGNERVDLTSTTTVTTFPYFYTKKGTFQLIEDVFSAELNNTRSVIMYLPPSYLENTLKVHSNVLVMHDGQNLFDRSTAFMGNAWLCQDALDSGIVGGLVEEVVVVGPYNTEGRGDEYTYIYDPEEEMGGDGDLYLDWIESTLLPLVSSELRVDIARDRLGILGSSLGGLISCYAGWTRPSVYGRVGCMSSSFWWADEDFQNNVVPLSAPTKPVPRFYMDWGTGSVGERECGLQTNNIQKQMVNYGFLPDIDVELYADSGATHSESYWGPRFHLPLEFLYPAPATLA